MNRFVAGSLGLHLLLLLIVTTTRRPADVPAMPGKKTSPQSLQVRSMTPKDLEKELAKALDSTEPRMQVVQADDQLKTEKAPDLKGPEKVFLSKHNNVVDKNTRAAKVGRFKNVLKEGVQAQQSTVPIKKLFDLSPNPKDQEQVKAQISKTGKLRTADPLRQPSAEATAVKGGDGESATDDFLDNVAVGANTLLNTKEFIFYSFYERIREKISPAWHSQLDEQLGRPGETRPNLNAENRTQVEVKLDPKGTLKSVRVLGTSGIAALDRAAIEAFRIAAPFPNPPRQMIVKESVSIRYDFVVLASADSGIRVEVKRAPAGL